MIELVPNKNSCIYQFIYNLKKGIYYLKVQWFPHSKSIWQEYSRWHVNFNEVQIGRFIPNDYLVHVE